MALWQQRRTGARPTPGSRSSRSTRPRTWPGSSSSRRASSRSRAGRTGTCTGAGRGRSASTRASRRPRRRTSASASCSTAGRPGSRSRSTCRRSSGYDSDDPRAAGEVGRTGVAIDSLADMELLFDGIPLGEVSTSMTINAPAALLLLLYELVAEGQGVVRRPRCAARCRTTSSRSTSRAGTTSTRRGRRCGSRPTCSRTAPSGCPSWNTISISGYHIREAGSTAVQELAFTLANGIAYCQAAVDAGLSPDEFGERLSFFFNAHNHFFQEVAKFRAARRLWAEIMRERFGATNPKAQALRFHAQTGGSTLTAQQPENNVARVTVQALAAVCGGAQSIHTNAFDEALALPTARSARIALRTQQILAARGRRHRHGRPARRRLLHRGDDRRARGARPRAARADRRARRRGRRGRAGVRPARDRGLGVPLPAGGRGRRARRSSASTATRRREEEPSSSSASTRRRSGASSSGRRACGPSATPRRPRRRSRRCAASPAGRRTCSRRCARRLRVRCTVGEICERPPRGVRDVRLAARLDVR